MQTAPPTVSSSAVNSRPLSSAQLPASRNSLVLPRMVELQLLLPTTSVAPLLLIGARALIPAISLRTASVSARVKAGALMRSRPGPKPCPRLIISRLLPRLAICSVTCAVAPLPSVTMVITAATPIMMPSVVKKERRILRRISCSASLKAFPSISPNITTLLQQVGATGRNPPGHRQSE